MSEYIACEERVLRVPNVHGFMEEALEYMKTFFWEKDIEGYAYMDGDWRHDFICIRSTTIPHYHELVALEQQCDRLELIDKSNYPPYFKDDGWDYYNILPESSEEQKAIFQQAKALHAMIQQEMQNQ